MIKKSKINSREDMLSCDIEHTMSVAQAQISLVEHLVSNDIEGDIIELGCGVGLNTQYFASVFNDFNRENIIYGCDTFCGYTEEDLKESESKFDIRLMEGYLKNQNKKRFVVDESIIKNRMESLGFGSITQIIKGDIKETTKDFTPKSGKISMLYIDCNIYGASKAGIDNLKEYFSDGCLVVVDCGFCNAPDPLVGEHEALFEYKVESGNTLYRTHFGNYVAFFVEVLKNVGSAK